MSLQERYTHYDCLLHSCLYPASCSVIMFIERATLHGAWEIFNIYEYNINQADN